VEVTHVIPSLRSGQALSGARNSAHSEGSAFEKQIPRAYGARDDKARSALVERRRREERTISVHDNAPLLRKTMMVSRLKSLMLIEDAHVLGVHHGKSLARALHRRDE
jgi:hypothetical protein